MQKPTFKVYILICFDIDLYISIRIKISRGTSLVVCWLRLHLPMQGAQVCSLVGELRSHMSYGQKTKNIKQKQYRNKLNKGLKKIVHIKNL